MVSSKDSLDAPSWNLENIFPSVDSQEYASEVESLASLLSQVETYIAGKNLGPDGSADLELLRKVLAQISELNRKLRLVRSFVSGHVTINSQDQSALAKASELDLLSMRAQKIHKRLVSWFAKFDSTEPFALDHEFAPFRFMFEKCSVESGHQLSKSEEDLASELEITGSAGWKKLHSNVASQIEVAISIDGVETIRSMSEARALASDPDRQIRCAAYESELAAWAKWRVPLAAALNGVKGEAITLSKRRGWLSPLDAALFTANIDRSILEAMHEAVRSSFPDFRKYLQLKAKRLGVERMAFYDLFAPIPGSSQVWEWQNAEKFVEAQFRSYSDELGDFAKRAFAEHWIDYPPRPGKVDGAYCMGVRADESRILMNFRPSFSAVSTLAHELGHGYHNLCLSKRSELLRTTPMTLAETASIFCETIVRRAVLKSAEPGEKVGILDASLTGACQVAVDVHSRFIFESEVFAARAKRELSPQEMCDLMVGAQRATYGDGLTESDSGSHPYMWAAKSHYYGRSYYNFPCVFGLLFALGLYEVYEIEGDAFRPRYGELLSKTGSSSPKDLAKDFGIDLADVSFWNGSVNQIRRDIAHFTELA